MGNGRSKHLDDVEYDERAGDVDVEHDGVIGEDQQYREHRDQSCYVMDDGAFHKTPAANMINRTSTSQKKSDEAIIEEDSHIISRAYEQTPY